MNANNLRAFYKFINKKIHSSSEIAPRYNDAGTLFTNDSEKANLLNSYFESVFIKDDGNLPNFFSRLPSANPPIELNDIHISPAILQRAMDKLKTNSAAGPDSLPPIFYRSAQHFKIPSNNFIQELHQPSRTPQRMEIFNHHS